ncbi:MFS monocarboxylate transporter [Aspergillus eucalypticola CBS 122712]|uniref:MFS monocarboxylate transporter n=1 Tax=Aspergillus eucalypticola (strain CBS 122712 / IBT 29274) TaxID=1448314 RepID=A0A317WES1_ASPEC|nr:MFS monocarboxylate transporter [Aspergillus eucalypticola CBS 122712]PWY82720.1 MFS monocarboxylate transporter [Aspergillus eucalypticola CBS 122712]
MLVKCRLVAGIITGSSGSSEAEKQTTIERMDTVPLPPPDGGLTAWLQVAGAFFLFFNSWGILNAYGVFQSYYQSDLIPTYSSSSITWIGTAQGFVLFLVGVIVGPIFDQGFLHSLIAFGTFMVVFGLMMTSLSTQYYQLFLAHGITVGIGCAFLFLPSIAIVATYFTSRRALATGITAAGGSIGAVVYPIMFDKLISRIGFGWTTRIIGLVALAGLSMSLLVLRRRLPPPTKSKLLLDLAALKEPPFLIFAFGLFFCFVGLYFPFFYLQSYFTYYLHSDSSLAFYIFSVLNATSVLGRITPGLMADRIGGLNTLVPISLLATILAFVWIAVRNVGGTCRFHLFVWIHFRCHCLPAAIYLDTHVSEPGRCGHASGHDLHVCWLRVPDWYSIASLVFVLEQGSFWKAQLFSGMFVAAGTMCFIALWVILWRRRGGWKI